MRDTHHPDSIHHPLSSHSTPHIIQHHSSRAQASALCLHRLCRRHRPAMVSALDQAKRALVALLRTLAAAYACAVPVTRDSADAEVASAYRKVSRKVHPDRRTGNEADQKRLNAAHQKWQALLNAAPGKGRRPQAGAPGAAPQRGAAPATGLAIRAVLRFACRTRGSPDARRAMAKIPLRRYNSSLRFIAVSK